jgi:hypothetical protein
LTSFLRLKRSILGWPVEGVAESLRRHDGDLLLQRHENESCVSAWESKQHPIAKSSNGSCLRIRVLLATFSVLLFFFTRISIIEVWFVVAARSMKNRQSRMLRQIWWSLHNVDRLTRD